MTQPHFFSLNSAICGMHRIPSSHAWLRGISTDDIPADTLGLVVPVAKRIYCDPTMDAPGIAAGVVAVVTRHDTTSFATAGFLVWSPPLVASFTSERLGDMFWAAFQSAGANLLAISHTMANPQDAPSIHAVWPEFEREWSMVDPVDLGVRKHGNGHN